MGLRAVRLRSLALLVACAWATGCGSGVGGERASSTAPAAARLKRALAAEDRSRYFEGVREAVVRGSARDFAQGTGIGGEEYAACVLGLLGEALDRPTIDRLVEVYRRPGGQALAAQALNRLASRLGAQCGHRAYVPELVEASRGLRRGELRGRAVEQLGLTYGPYLGVRCRRSNRVCEKVGIDVVLGHAASSVVATVGDEGVRLRTPGLHNGIRYRDWVGTFTHARVGLPGSGFALRGGGPLPRSWAGDPPVHVALELDVRYVDGHRRTALFPDVVLSPGWG